MKMTHYLREHIEDFLQKRAPENILALSAETAAFCVSLQTFWPRTKVHLVAYPFTDYLGSDPDGRIAVTLDSPALPRKLDRDLPAMCSLCVVCCNEALDNGQNFLHARAAALHVPLILGMLPEHMEGDDVSPEVRLPGVRNFAEIYASEEYEPYLVSDEGKIFSLNETEELERVNFIAAFGVYRGQARPEIPEPASLSVQVRNVLRESGGDGAIEEARVRGELSRRFMIDPLSPRLSFPSRPAAENEPPARFRLSREALAATVAVRAPDCFYLDKFMYGSGCMALAVDSAEDFPVEMSWLRTPLENFATHVEELLADVSGPWGMVVAGFFTRLPNRGYFLPVAVRQVWFEGSVFSRLAWLCRCDFFPGQKAMAAFAPGHGAFTRAGSVCDSSVWEDWYAQFEDSSDGFGVTPAQRNGPAVIYGRELANRALDVPLLEAMLAGDETTVMQCNAIVEGGVHV